VQLGEPTLAHRSIDVHYSYCNLAFLLKIVRNFCLQFQLAIWFVKGGSIGAQGWRVSSAMRVNACLQTVSIQMSRSDARKCLACFVFHGLLLGGGFGCGHRCAHDDKLALDVIRFVPERNACVIGYPVAFGFARVAKTSNQAVEILNGGNKRVRNQRHGRPCKQ
jgi:hypothetical protein